MQKEYPEYFENFCGLYQKGGADPQYKQQLYTMVNDLRSKYKLSASYSKPMKEKLK